MAVTIWPSIFEEVGGGASGISPQESKECGRSPENNGELTVPLQTCDVGSEGGSQLFART